MKIKGSESYSVAVALLAVQVSLIKCFFLDADVDCPPIGELFIPHHDCNKFYICSNGFANEMECPANLYWNPRKNECDNKINVPECVGGTRPPEMTLTTPEPPISTTFQESTTLDSVSTIDPMTTEPSTITPEPTTYDPPTTPEPTTFAPSTMAPTTISPEPTTYDPPTTPEPTTLAPSTMAPTTITPEPTTYDPPTTPEPTTFAPSTMVPTTVTPEPTTTTELEPSTTVETSTITETEEVITSPNITNWGTWAPVMEKCPTGTFATGFQLKSQVYGLPDQDDTSMNGIKLYCGSPSSPNTVSVTSTVGPWGEWRNNYQCFNAVITGFQLRVQVPGTGDQTATNNIRIFCSNTEDYVQGDAEYWGEWVEERHCSMGRGVCGLQTQVQEEVQDGGDNTSLNNVKMLCCDL